MKKYLMIILALASLNAQAFTGTGNDRIDEVREYQRYKNGGDNIDWSDTNWYVGVVTGLISVFNELSYPYSICYPENSTVGQLSEIAANFVIDNPQIREKSLNYLVWESHSNAFGYKSNASCFEHDAWKEFNS